MAAMEPTYTGHDTDFSDFVMHEMNKSMPDQKYCRKIFEKSMKDSCVLFEMVRLVESKANILSTHISLNLVRQYFQIIIAIEIGIGLRAPHASLDQL